MYRLALVLLVVWGMAACHTNKSNTSETTVESPVTPPEPVTAVFELTDDNFSEKMKKGEGLRLAYFTASWCGPCRVVGPTVDKVSTNYQGEILMGKMDVDTNLTDAFNNIKTVPTILFFKDGAEVYRTFGIVSEAYLVEVIERLR